jgi:hypothetical protein
MAPRPVPPHHSLCLSVCLSVCLSSPTRQHALGSADGEDAVPPAYTSQGCSGCWERIHTSLSVRTHVCTHCGLILDCDENAARNIHWCGQRLRGLPGMPAVPAVPAVAEALNREPAALYGVRSVRGRCDAVQQRQGPLIRLGRLHFASSWPHRGLMCLRRRSGKLLAAGRGCDDGAAASLGATLDPS